MPNSAKAEPDRIAQKLDGFTNRICEQTLQAERPMRRPGRRAAGSAVGAAGARASSGCARCGGFFEIADEGVLERGGAAPSGEVRRRIGGEHAPGIHQRDAVAARGLVHEMGGDENRHALIARQIDEQFPEPVARQRIDARGRLVEDEHFRLMNDGDRQRQPLANAERQDPTCAGRDVRTGRIARRARRRAIWPSLAGRWNSRAWRSRFCRTVSSV